MMDKFDLEKSLATYLDKVCSGIRSKKKRALVAREYREHIEDAMYRYKLSGMSEEEAFAKALNDLGTPETYSELLSDIHNSKNPAADVEIPSDIKKHIKRKITKKLLLCVGILLLLTVIWLVASEYLIDYLGIVNVAAIFVFSAISGVISTGIFKFVFDRAWQGEIIKVDVERVLQSYWAGEKVRGHYEQVIRLYIKKDNGKIIIYNAMRLSETGNKEASYMYNTSFAEKYVAVGDIEKQVKNYSEGDKVYHFYGLDHIFVWHFENMERVNCVVCGTKNPKGEKECAICGHTLLTDLIIDI